MNEGRNFRIKNRPVGNRAAGRMSLAAVNAQTKLKIMITQHKNKVKTGNIRITCIAHFGRGIMARFCLAFNPLR